MEASDTIKNHLLNLHSRFSKYFPETEGNKLKWITDPFMLIQITTSLSIEKKKHTAIVSDTSLKVQFPRKLYMEFWMGIGGEFRHLTKRALKILLTFAKSYQCGTGFQQ